MGDKRDLVIYVYTKEMYNNFVNDVAFTPKTDVKFQVAELPDGCVGLWKDCWVCTVKDSVVDWYINEMEYLKQNIVDLEEELDVLKNTSQP